MESFNANSETFSTPENVEVSSYIHQPAISDQKIAVLEAQIMDLLSRVAQVEARCDARCGG
jgi:hypothetical protein